MPISNTSKGTHENNTTNSPANLEPDISDAPFSAEAIAGLNPPCCIHIHSLRHRLADADGISGKAVIDGIVHAEILSDDSAKTIREVTYSQEKIATADPETTIITITCHDKEG